MIRRTALLIAVLPIFPLAVLQAPSLTLTSPVDYQVIQRTSKDGGVISIAGTLAGAGATSVEARIADATRKGEWKRLEARISDGSFQAAMTLPVGGWHPLEVRVLDGDRVMAESTVGHVGVGEVFVVAGQSNSANHGEEKQKTATGLVAAFDGEHWRLANDPQPGASGGGGSFMPPLGDALAVRFKVPVGFVPCGIGATSVREWLPAGARFPNPPTLVGRVRPLPEGEWESNGQAFATLTGRMKKLGRNGFRAVLWHQGESDANQKDSSRTLPGDLYRKYLEQVIRDSRREIGWEAPWFVAQVSYHVPGDEASADIRAAQKALWDGGIALEGPDSDALKGDLRERKGQGVHFSGKGLREHAARWAEKIAPWLEKQTGTAAPDKKLPLPGEVFLVEQRVAFVIPAENGNPAGPVPWVWYAPTLPGLPGNEERWMFEKFTKAGIAVAGIDVGESYGSPDGRALYSALYRELTGKRGFAARPVLLGRSRGGLMTLCWAAENADKVGGFAGIYPVCNILSYPGVAKACGAYHMTPEQLTARLSEHNPIDRLEALARAKVPLFAIHGDVDKPVPLEANSGEVKKRYEALGGRVHLVVPQGQGHNMWAGFFQCAELADFVIRNAKRAD